MEHVAKKVKNWWWYHKTYVLLAVLVLAVAAYMFGLSAGSPEPDYHIGLVSTSPYSDDALRAMEDTFAAQGSDLDGDGQVLVQIHTYAVDLADTSENAGYNNYEIIAALDADLVGKVSGIFLLEDPETFQQITNGVLQEPFVPYGNGLYLCLRSDAGDAYIQLLENTI